MAGIRDDRRLVVGVLGPLEISSEQRALEVTGHMRRAILARLAVAGSAVVSTEQLIADLWEDHPPTRARTTLQTHISQMRKQLVGAGHAVATSGPGYCLDAAWATSDAALFEEAIRDTTTTSRHHGVSPKKLAYALGLWRGPPLEEFGEYHWARASAVRFTELRFEALDARITMDLAGGGHRALIAELQQLVEQEPLRENLTGHLMLALYRAGRQADALRAYSRLRGQLRDELGIEPSQPLRLLEEEILLQKPHLDWRSPPQGPSTLGPTTAGAQRNLEPSELASFVDRLPFVGRERELAELRQLWASVTAGRSRLVLVNGEMGSGKTRLVGEWLRSLRGSGCLALTATAVDDLEAPFQPLIEALAPLQELGLVETLDHVFSAEGPAATGLDPELRRARLWGWFRDVLVAIAADDPVVLVIDDLHWADASTIAVLERLDAHDVPLLVVGLCDPAGLHPNHPLRGLLVRQAGEVATIEVPQLELDDVRALVEASGRDSTAAESTDLWERTEGNALFVSEALRIAGSDTRTGGLVELLSWHLRTLSDAARRCLRVAAVIGVQFDFDTLVSASDMGEASALDALEESVDAGVIIESAHAGRFRFTHRMVAEVIHDSMGETRRQWLHGRVGEAISTGVDATSIPSLLATAEHFGAAGPRFAALAATAFLDAARKVGDVLDPARALALVERGHAALGWAAEGEIVETTRLGLMLVEAQVHVVAGDFVQARRLADDAVALAEASDDLDALALAATVRGTSSQIGVADESGIALSRNVLDRLDDSALRARLLASLAMQENAAGRGWDTENLTRDALAAALGAGDLNAAILAAWARGLTLTGSERLDEVRAAAAFLHETAVEHDASELMRLSRRLTSVADLVAGQRGALEETVAVLDTEISAGTVPLAPAWRAALAMMDGRFTAARPDIEVSLAAAADPNFLAIYVGQMFWLHRERGQLGELIPVLEDTVSNAPGMLSFASALALAEVTAGDSAKGRRVFERCTRGGPGDLPRDLTWPSTVASLAEVASFLRDRTVAEWLCDLLVHRTDQLAVVALGTYCAGAYDRFSGMLLSVLGRDQDAREAFHRAVELETRVRAPALLARTRYWFGAHLLRSGATEEATPLLHSAHDAAASFGMVELQRHAADLLAG